MSPHDADLIEGIQRDVLDSSVAISDALRKCLVLGGRAGSTQLRDWARRELQGYTSSDDELPPYRILAAPICIDGMTMTHQVTGQTIAPSSLPDFVQDKIRERVELRGGIEEIEQLLARPEEPIRIGIPMGAEIARLMNAQSGTGHIERIYWSPAHSLVRGLVDQVRTNLALLVAELRASMSDDQAVPSAEQADQALSVVVTGKRSSVNVTTAQATGSSRATVGPSKPEASPFWTRSRRIGAAVVGAATITSAVIALIALL